MIWVSPLLRESFISFLEISNVGAVRLEVHNVIVSALLKAIL